MARRARVALSQPSGPILGLIALFVIGLFAGFLFGGIWARVGQQGIKEEDYIVLVSAIYERERSLANAQERLSILDRSDVALATASLADAYPRAHPEAQTEARALRGLANALKASTSERPGVGTGADKSEGGSGGPWLWVATILVVVVLLAVGGPVAFRMFVATRGGLPSQGPGSPKLWSGNPPRSRSRPSPTAGQPENETPSSMTGARDVLRRLRSTPGSPGTLGQPGRNSSRPPLTFQPSTTSGQRFESHYRLGDEPYDEVHPIIDRSTGDLIGACGVSAVLKLPDAIQPRYYAFAIWLHDYASNQPVKTMGLASRWAHASAPPELVGWAGHVKLDDVLVVTQDLRFTIQTISLRLDVTIQNFRFGTEVESPRDSYFTNLEAIFDVNVKQGAGTRAQPEETFDNANT